MAKRKQWNPEALVKQALDVAFMFPFKTHYAAAIENWLWSHSNRIVRKLQIDSLFGEAYSRAATVQNAISGFSKTGIAPFNPNAFGDADFLSHQQESEQAEIHQQTLQGELIYHLISDLCINIVLYEYKTTIFFEVVSIFYFIVKFNTLKGDEICAL